MDFRDASMECCLQGFHCQRLRQLLTQMPRPYHTREGIHEQSDRDEVSFQAHISDIADPDLVASGDFKGLKSVDIGTLSLKRCRGLTDTFDGHRKIRGFHQSRNPAIPNGVSLIHQELCDTPIPVCRIPAANASISVRRTSSDGSIFG